MFRIRAVALIAFVGFAGPLATALPTAAGPDEPAGCAIPPAGEPAPVASDSAPAATSESASAASPDEVAAPLVGAWCVVSVGSIGAAEVVATVEFTAGGEVFGVGGVNRFSGTYTVDGDSVEFGPIMSTLMAGPEPAMALESALFAALSEAQPFSIDGAVLTIGTGDSAVVLEAAADPAPAGAAIVVSGTVTYLQRSALPDGAIVTVRVSDVSIADIAAPVVAEVVITPMTEVPIPYAIAVPTTLLEARHSYSLSVRITLGDDLLFTSTESLPVILDAATQTVDVVVTPA